MLVEYDGYGECLREYIYIGAKMVAEYQPQTGKYYYYTTDQIGSTRIVTDDAGNIVYAAAHDPYGGVQQTWVNTFNPELKFSGKEQDTESGLYYFGARYYDPSLYRFLSPDPVIPTDRALYDPQRWNPYGYCLGDPINLVDIIGMWVGVALINLYRVPPGFRLDDRKIFFYGSRVGRTDPDWGNIYITKTNAKEELIFVMHFSIYILEEKYLKFWGTTYEKVYRHEFEHIEHMLRHSSPFLDYIEKKYFEEIKTLGPEKALEKAKERFYKYELWIGRIGKAYLDDLFGIAYDFWKDINDNWLHFFNDPFLKWVLHLDFMFQ